MGGMPGPNALACTVLESERHGKNRVPLISRRRPKNRAAQAGFQAIDPVASRHKPVSAPPIASFTGPAPWRKCPSVACRATGHKSATVTVSSRQRNLDSHALNVLFIAFSLATSFGPATDTDPEAGRRHIPCQIYLCVK